jgi:ubiquinone biosynthesis monooxygenase Coq6
MLARRSVILKPGFVCRSCVRQYQFQLRRASTSTQDNIYDVVCVGGGPAGLSLLTALRKLLVLVQLLQRLISC